MLPLFNIKAISILLSYLFLGIVIYVLYQSNVSLNADLANCNVSHEIRDRAILQIAETEKASHSKAIAAQKLAMSQYAVDNQLVDDMRNEEAPVECMAAIGWLADKAKEF